MACLVQSISHTPLWCLLLTMLIIPLSICRPSPSIIFPQIAVLLTREQFLKSLQTLYSFSQLLPPFWPGAERALSQAGSGQGRCLCSGACPCPIPRLGGLWGPQELSRGRELSQAGWLQGHTPHPVPWGLLLAQPSHKEPGRLCAHPGSLPGARLSWLSNYAPAKACAAGSASCHRHARAGLRAAPSREQEPEPWVPQHPCLPRAATFPEPHGHGIAWLGRDPQGSINPTPGPVQGSSAIPPCA